MAARVLGQVGDILLLVLDMSIVKQSDYAGGEIMACPTKIRKPFCE